MTRNLKYLFILSLLFGNISHSLSQETNSEEKYKAKPIALVFADMYSSINQGNNPSAIEIQRAYIGYDIELEKGFSTKIVLDIGSPDNTSAYSLLKRYAYFKTAYLQYKSGKFNFKFGIIPMQLFKIQEKVWGHRYIAKSAADKYKFGSSADLGVSANYKVASFAEIDFTFSNGEGNAELQNDNTYKGAFGITLKPYKGLIIRSFGDFMSKSTDQITLVGFIGYQIDKKLSIGVEIDKQFNVKHEINEDLMIYSGTVSYSINNKFQLFGRYDIFRSNILEDEIRPWNIANDGSAIVSGIQYSPISNIRMAINYQDWVPYAENLDNETFVYFNIEFGL